MPPPPCPPPLHDVGCDSLPVSFLRQLHNFITTRINYIDDDELSSTTVDSKYYDISQLNSLNPHLSSSFGMFHVNIASLNKHIDDPRLILSALEFKFDIIGISEHKFRKGSAPKNNIDIPGYHSFIFQHTELSHGGTGFYLKTILTLLKDMTWL